MQQWVCWKAEERNGKISKVPINAKTGGYAMSNNPATWSDFQTAVKMSRNFSGIGFMLGNGIFGVDLDDMDDEIERFKNGDSDNIIAEFVYTLESYAEYSPSGKGIHILCKGELPPGGRRKGNFEFYENGRFFTVTGNIASEYIEVADCTETVKYLHSKYLGIS